VYTFDRTKPEFEYIELLLSISVDEAYLLRTGQEIPPPLRLPKWELKGEECPIKELKLKYPKLHALAVEHYGWDL
jgi:hypothetical protein